MDCSFCGHPMTPGTGKIYVKTDGKIYYFCSMKCEKNTLKLRHIPRRTEWTQEYARVKKGVEKEAGKDVGKQDGGKDAEETEKQQKVMRNVMRKK